MTKKAARSGNISKVRLLTDIARLGGLSYANAIMQTQLCLFCHDYRLLQTFSLY